MLSMPRLMLSAALAALGAACALDGAYAACSTLAGTWYIYDSQGTSPAISTVNQQVVIGPTVGDVKNIPIFDPNHPFNNNTAGALGCTLKVQSNGATTASCLMYTSGKNLIGKTSTGTGTLSVKACNLTGSISMKNDPTPIVIRAGHINGNVGGGIATHGNQVNTFVFVRQ